MALLARARHAVSRLYYQLRKVVLRARIGDRWEARPGELRSRVYPDYGTYVEHQKTKFGAWRWKSIRAHDERFLAALTARLTELPLELHGARVLCLGARQGSEVRAFIDRGAFAVGIDLNPGRDNRYVVVGDFHDIQYGDGSVDLVYTNSLDHAFDLDRILAEVARVLRPGGCLMVEANADDDAGGAVAGPYESTTWASVDALASRIGAAGFRLTGRRPFDAPWRGEQLLFERPSPAASS